MQTQTLEGDKYTLNERLGMTELNTEVSKFTFANDIETLGRFGFNTSGIEDAVRALISINGSSQPERFVSVRGNEPVQWRPYNIGMERKEEEEFSKRMQEPVEVYFWDFNAGMVNPNKFGKEPWHNLMRNRFLPLVKDVISGGPIRYDYGTGEYSNKIVTEFKPDKDREKTWQIWAPFFDNALTAYSCFVNGGISINSWNYTGHPTYERYGHSRIGVWKGKICDFVKNAKTIENALRTLNPSASGGSFGEVKMIHPDLGMIVMRSEGKRYEAFHPEFYLRAERRYVNAPKTMIFGKYAFAELLKDFSR